jgi:hypothetical protein
VRRTESIPDACAGVQLREGGERGGVGKKFFAAGMVMRGEGWQVHPCKDDSTGADSPTLEGAGIVKVKRLLLILCLAGCAHSAPRTDSSSVVKDMILPLGAVREQLRQNQVFLAPVPINEPMPDFPDGYPTQGDADIDICVELSVSSDGAIDDVKQISAADGCEPPGSAASVLFYPQVAAAVGQWTYFGAAICTFESREGECDSTDAALQAVPVKLAYRFKFRVVDGRRSVRRAER